ncbi:MAG: hypothetical protein AAFY08_05315 [Planctomycetota bacterium]
MAEPADQPGVTRSDRDWLLDYLADRDALCPNCHYNLRGLTGTTCPECGLGLALRVNLVEPRLAAWLVGLIGLTMSLGWSGCFLVLFVGVLLTDGGIHDAHEPLLFFSVGTLISGGLAALWLRGRPWFRRQSSATRRALAAVCWLLPTLNVCIFGLIAR